MRHASLFSGIGGFDLAAQWMGWENIFHCEIEEFQQRVLKQHFPNSIPYHDVTKLDARKYINTIDVLTGGFPCQDLSSSGAMRGITGSRSGLWFEMFRIITECCPKVVVIENSPNLLKKGFEKVLYPLSEEGYNVEWQCVRASDIGAPHERERVYVVAYSNEVGQLENSFFEGINREKYSKRPSTTTHGATHFNGRTYPKIPQNLLLDDGVSYELDFVGAFGNAIEPTVAYQIFKSIEIAFDMTDHQFSLFGFVPPRRKKAITPARMEEARREIERTGWKPSSKTLSKIADQLEHLEQRITTRK